MLFAPQSDHEVRVVETSDCMNEIASTEMRLRAILASLVAVLLLSISCVASSCETSCDLKALGYGCHNASPASAASPMAGMHDSGMDNDYHSAQVQANHQCKHAVCVQQPQTVASDLTVLHAKSLATLRALVAVLVFPLSTLDVRIEPANSAPPRVPLLVAFQTTLRV